MAEQMEEMRAAYARTLVEMAARDDRVVVLEADLMKATGTGTFKDAFPDRFFNAGVAEANMVGVAAGLAAEGKIPFAATFACFASRRAFDQFFISCNYGRLGVKLVGTDPGISAAFNGGTHMPFEDLGILRTVPRLAILEPSDPVSLRGLLPRIAAYEGSAYLRLHRKAAPALYPEGTDFRIGEAKILREGGDAAIVALGAILVPQALRAAELLSAQGIEASVVDALSVKPLDADRILERARACGVIVTAENHQIAGGLGSAVAELLAETGAFRLARVGIRDEFGEVGTQDWLMDRFGLGAERIAQAVRDLLSRKT